MNKPTRQHRYYVTFPAGVSEGEADQLLAKWGALREAQEGEAAVLEGELCLPVLGTEELPRLVKATPGVSIYDNETRPELY